MDNNNYIKISKTALRNFIDNNDKTLCVLLYLCFHQTCNAEIYTSIDCICTELNLSLKSHGERRNQNVIKDILSNLIDDQIISFINTNYCDRFETIKNNQLFKIKFNPESSIFNISYGYVIINNEEYKKLFNIKNANLYKHINAYCYLKSYICMDEKCLHICYPTLKTLSNNLKCSNKTLSSLLRDLYASKLIYIYKFDTDTLPNTRYTFEYVFSIEKYTKDDIYKELSA